jgi:predicted Zn finger-like uncharacterized protein
MLVTTCTHCGARFRVLPGQLNLRQGQVRCGECQKIFNGFETLKGFKGDEPELGPAYPQADPEPLADPEPQVVEATIETEDPAEAPGDITLPAEADEPPPVEAEEPPPAGDRYRPASANYEAFVPQLPARPARAWAFGVVLLALVLALQLAYAYRAPLAQRYPMLRPALESTCAAAGCTVAWVNEESALKLEDSDLVEVPGKAGQIALQARIRNLAPTPQEFPHIELTLSDVSGQTAIRRVLRPADYLGRAPAPGEVMAAGSEAAVSIRFDTGNVKPTGYELLLFYP